MIPTTARGPGWTETTLFQSRNRETYDSNDILTRAVGMVPQFQSRNRETYDSNFLIKQSMDYDTTSFNLVIEKLMIPTFSRKRYSKFNLCQFQSRNRETYDSNHQAKKVRANRRQYRFNLVIEKLMIPTCIYPKHSNVGRTSFNLVIEKLMIPTISEPLVYLQWHEFQSRNRETYDSN